MQRRKMRKATERWQTRFAGRVISKHAQRAPVFELARAKLRAPICTLQAEAPTKLLALGNDIEILHLVRSDVASAQLDFDVFLAMTETKSSVLTGSDAKASPKKDASVSSC